jgi:poly(3-hydroxybutyrate) depolymerase
MRVIHSLFALLAFTVLGTSAVPSPGCGKAPKTLQNGRNTINVNGESRQFIIRLPDDYDNKNAYRVIFAFHATGGNAAETARSYYGLLLRAGNSSILVSPDGRDLTAGGGKVSELLGKFVKGITGWWHVGGKFGEQDLEFVDKIVEVMDAELCVDTRRRFATGFSFGGVISHSLACLRADTFRAVSVQSGANFDAVIGGMSGTNKGKGNGIEGPKPKANPPGTCKKTDSFSASWMGVDPSMILDPILLGDKKAGSPMVCGTKPVAYMGFMGICDGWIAYGRQARDEFVRNNGCKPKEPQLPAEGSKQRVQTTWDCQPDTPVVWTDFDGQHQPTREAEADTWKFFSQFK